MKVSDLLAASLEREGVDHVFGIPGEELEEVLFSLQASDVTFVPTRHEQGAAFMADVYGRLTGTAGVCLATLGPGATNLLTGVADAHLDRSPVVAITGQGGRERLHHESHQAIDVVDIFEPVTEWNVQLDDPGIVHESVRKAFKRAEYEKPGVTHLELPEDVAAEQTDARPLPRRRQVQPGTPDPDVLHRATEQLAAADRPLVLVGNGALRARASAPLRRLVEATDLPVVSTFMAKGAIPDDDDRSLLTVESGPDREATAAIGRADLLLSIGYDIAEHDPADWDLGETPIVHVDAEPAEVYEEYDPDVEVVGGIDRTVAALAAWADDEGTAFDAEWYAPLRERIADGLDRDAGEPPFTVEELLPALRDVLDPTDVLVSDVGSHKLSIARSYPIYEPNTCVVSNGLASMGIAVPGALAADLATDADVVAATGDGGFLMNAAELETAARIGCEYTVVVFVDGGYGVISEQQREHRGDAVGTAFTNPDFVAFAESFGIDGYRVEAGGELQSTLERAVDGGLALVEIPVETARHG